MKADDDEMTWNAAEDSEILGMAEMSKVTRPPIAPTGSPFAASSHAAGFVHLYKSNDYSNAWMHCSVWRNPTLFSHQRVSIKTFTGDSSNTINF